MLHLLLIILTSFFVALHACLLIRELCVWLLRSIRKGTTVCNPNGSIAFQTRDAMFSLHNKETVYDALNKVGNPGTDWIAKGIALCDDAFCCSPGRLAWET